jgi:hypothetical protein
MANFTKERRQEIIQEFAVRHNGNYNPRIFLEEVERVGPLHPAHGWFEWDADKAAFEHKLWQAREFAKGLRVTFQVEEVGQTKPVRIRQTETPLVISPIATRRDGGGYKLFDANDPSHMAEHCRQAAQAMETWLRRYGSAVEFAGGSMRNLERLKTLLEQAAKQHDIAA